MKHQPHVQVLRIETNNLGATQVDINVADAEEPKVYKGTGSVTFDVDYSVHHNPDEIRREALKVATDLLVENHPLVGFTGRFHEREHRLEWHIGRLAEGSDETFKIHVRVDVVALQD